VVEEHVNQLPKHVVERLVDLLDDVRVVGRYLEDVVGPVGSRTGPAEKDRE
jgi:hypothetical protein